MKEFQVVTSSGNTVFIKAEKARWNSDCSNVVEFLDADGGRVGVFTNFQQWVEVADSGPVFSEHELSCERFEAMFNVYMAKNYRYVATHFKSSPEDARIKAER